MSAGYYYVGSYYVDLTTPSAPVLYRCITSGDKTTSVWAQVSGGGSPKFEAYNNAHSYAPGSIVSIFTSVTVSGIVILPGVYLCIVTVPTSGTANQIPQFPLPTSGTVYWYAIAFGPSAVGICGGGGSSTIYANATASF